MRLPSIQWGARRGDITAPELVLVVLTRTPEEWLPALEAWQRAGSEWIVCSLPWGSGSGAGGIARAILDAEKQPVICLDESGLHAIVECGTRSQDWPREVPVIAVLPGEGWSVERVRARGEMEAALRELGWHGRYGVAIDPDPMEVAAWGTGFWRWSDGGDR